MRCWCGYLSGARCRLFAYGPSDATAIPKPHCLLLHLNPDWFHLTHTHTTVKRPLVRDNPGRPVPEETLTHSHPSWSLDILYQLPPFTTIHSILCVQFTCLTVLFDNLSPGPLWSSSWSWTLYFILHAFLHPISIIFSQHMPNQHSLFCCNTSAMSSIPSLSLTAPYLEICLLA